MPGVGAFDYGMKNLIDMGIVNVLREKVIDSGTPLLGICLGMQLLTEDSEEGVLPGLGFFKAHTKRFQTHWGSGKLKVPHMGWNYVRLTNETPLFNNCEENTRFYFVHSYYVECENKSDSIASTEYGVCFTSAIGRDNIFGVQFHPEKSHRFGLSLLKNFVERV